MHRCAAICELLRAPGQNGGCVGMSGSTGLAVSLSLRVHRVRVLLLR